MKPYFAKYLPVEGEIKDGEKYWNKQYNTADDIVGEIHVATLKNHDFQTAKLFLCSRDISLDDIVYHPFPGHWGKVSGDKKIGWVDVFKGQGKGKREKGFFPIAEKDGRWVDKVNMEIFKVIGEISPEATWIKERDEFDENELQFMFSEGSHAGITTSLERIKELSTIASNNKLRIKVKGPCGHFH